MSLEDSAVKLLEPTVKELYSDAVAPAMREFGKMGADAVKVLRLALFPLQLGAVLQDRLGRYLSQSIEMVPEDRRITPRDSIMLPVAEKLRHQDEDGNPIAKLYVNLLARAMDRERVGEAHPAFVHLVSQLAPDEVLLLEQLQQRPSRVYFRIAAGENALLRNECYPLFAQSAMSDAIMQSFLDAAFAPEELAQPELFLTFLEHLVSLGIAEYTNTPRSSEEAEISKQFLGFEHFYIRLTAFGQLFHRACIDAGQSPLRVS